LFASISHDILTQVASSTTAAEAWDAIDAMIPSQSRARIITMRMQLATVQNVTQLWMNISAT